MDVVIIGAGASGMLAALTAAEDKSNSVMLLERQQRVGRKLSATGNGRCNITNTGAGPEHYHGEDADFAKYALEAFSSADAIKYFRSLGLLTVTEYGGRVYPLSNSANSVVDVLRFALERSGVDTRCSCSVKELRHAKRRFTVVTDSGSVEADRVIVACGGAAGAKLGGVSDGYELLKALGHKRTALRPALVQLVTDSEYPRALKGIRADGALRLYSAKSLIAESFGELQFTERGLSGPAVFDISRAVSCQSGALRLEIDLLSAFSEREIVGLLCARSLDCPFLTAADLLTGIVHNRLGRMLVKYCGINAARPLCELEERELHAAARSCKSFSLAIIGTEGFDNAQITAGGVRTSGFEASTLESLTVPGLFACGELLDIDGDCGGYNLQWAWASGRLAGRLGK